MRRGARAIVLGTLISALAVFAVVQDRVTTDGARQYAERQRAALAGSGPPVTVDEVMVPAVRESVRTAAAWSAAVLACGLGAAAVASTRGRG